MNKVRINSSIFHHIHIYLYEQVFSFELLDRVNSDIGKFDNVFCKIKIPKIITRLRPRLES